MSKIAFLYPGQGAQDAGMGKDYYEKIPLAKEVIDKSYGNDKRDYGKRAYTRHDSRA